MTALDRLANRLQGLGRLYFVAIQQSATDEHVHSFLTATAAIKRFHDCVNVQRSIARDGTDDQTGERRWRVTVQSAGIATPLEESELVMGWDEDDAMQSYSEVTIKKLMNKRLPTPSGQTFLFCEGIRGLLWLLESPDLCGLYKEYVSPHTAIPLDDAALFAWVTEGPISKADLIAVLDEVASKNPDLVPFEARVQLSLQIMQAQYEIEGLRFQKRKLAMN